MKTIDLCGNWTFVNYTSKFTSAVFLRQKADEELLRMETTAGEPTDDSRVGTFTLESPCKVLHQCNCHGTLNAVCFSLSQDKFIQYLLKGTETLSPEYALQNDDTISHIINCSTGILILASQKCDIQDNPNPTVSSKECVTATALSNHTHFVIITAVTVRWCWVLFPLQSLFESVFEIFRTISVLVGKATKEKMIIRHPAGTIYQSRLVFSSRV